MRSLAIVGEFGSGKSTIANELVDNHGFTRVSLAGRLKETAASVFNYGRPIEKTDTYDVVREDGSIDAISGRQVLQELGQSVKTLDRDFWIRWLMSDVNAGKYGDGPFVVDDCRFPYEANSFRRAGWKIVRLVVPFEVRMERYEHQYGRLPTEAELSHPSETEVKNIVYDFSVNGLDSPADIVQDILALSSYERSA